MRRPFAFSALVCLTISVSAAVSETTALPLRDFLNSIGACTHIAQGIDNPTNVAECLAYAGIRNIRDDASTSEPTVRGWIYIHKRCGAKVCLLPVNGDVERTLAMDEALAAEGALLAVEGPNEPNNFPVKYHGVRSSKTNSLPVAEFQRDLYKAVKDDPKLSGIPVFASSEAGGSEPNNCGLQFLKIPANAGTLMPEGTVFGDFANTHNYVCDHLTNICDNNAWDAEDPALNGRWDGMHVEYGHTWWKPGYDGYSDDRLRALPKVTTETGWVTRGKDAITEEQQARLFLNLYLAAFKRGWSYTFVYMLRDDPGQGYWGLFRTNYAPKPSAIYLHNLTTILGAGLKSVDPGGRAANREALPCSIPNEPATAHDLLLEKGGGVWDLVIWSERANGSDDVTINFGSGIDSARVYDPTTGTAPVGMGSGNTTDLTLSVSDHPLVIEVVRRKRAGN